MTTDPKAPCIIGVAQQVWRPSDTGADGAPEPLAMWEQVARAAAHDTGAARGDAAVLAGLESIAVVYCQSWAYDDPARRLADVLGAAAGHRHYSGIGGTTTQQLVDRAAESILAGDIDLALIAGGEAIDTRRRLKKQDREPAWSFPVQGKRPFPFEAPFIDAEVNHDVVAATVTFPLFDIARRAHLGIGVDDYRTRLGELIAPMSRVAATNPYAWFPTERTPAEVITPSAGNRMVGYPYTKGSLAMMDVDLAGALVVASHERADELGVPVERRVYLRGWCYATDPTYVAEHVNFHESPAMRAASTEALARAGLDLDDVAHLDLYSCFGSALHLAIDALGLAPDDPRGLTVTGGLPFAGGPGSNYMTHSIAAMVDRLRADPGAAGLVSGIGMHMTKHVFGVYSTVPPERVEPGDAPTVQARLDEARFRAIEDTATGSATLATYTVMHGRDGSPAWGLAICDLPAGTRCYAKILDPELLADLEVEEWVGRSIHLVSGDHEGLPAHVNIARA